MTTTQSMTATALPGHRSPVDPAVTVVEAASADLRAELAYRNVRAEVPRDVLRERAESYASDARRFAGMPRLGQASDVLTEEDCKRFAVMYRTIADELRKVAASL